MGRISRKYSIHPPYFIRLFHRKKLGKDRVGVVMFPSLPPSALFLPINPFRQVPLSLPAKLLPFLPSFIRSSLLVLSPSSIMYPTEAAEEGRAGYDHEGDLDLAVLRKITHSIFFVFFSFVLLSFSVARPPILGSRRMGRWTPQSATGPLLPVKAS